MDTIKTAVSVNKALFEKAEEMARALDISRSRLYALALEEYIRRQENRALLERLNAAYADDLDAEEEAALVLMRKLHHRAADGEW
jgi:predicted transcriptional regulator